MAVPHAHVLRMVEIVSETRCGIEGMGAYRYGTDARVALLQIAGQRAVTSISCMGRGGQDRAGQRRTTICASKIARIGTKLCENAFQTIPVKSNFSRNQKKSTKFFGLG